MKILWRASSPRRLRVDCGALILRGMGRERSGLDVRLRLEGFVSLNAILCVRLFLVMVRAWLMLLFGEAAYHCKIEWKTGKRGLISFTIRDASSNGTYVRVASCVESTACPPLTQS